MTPGRRERPGVFLLARIRVFPAQDHRLRIRSNRAIDFVDCIWRGGDPRAVRLARFGAGTHRLGFSLWHACGEYYRLPSTGGHRGIRLDASRDSTGMAHWHHYGIPRRVHDIFDIHVGNRALDPGRRMAARVGLFGREFDRRLARGVLRNENSGPDLKAYLSLERTGTLWNKP